MRTPKDLPPLAALRVFETVARLQSFRQAGEELCISQSAVSYHVKSLETHVGARLFVRHARGISFTPEGQTYFEVIRQAFDQIGQGTAALRGPGAEGAVRVSVLPSFAAGWLVPRLGKFSAAHPRVQVSLDPRLSLADLEAGEADLAIRYGHGDWPGTERHQLFTEDLSPVASPSLLRRGPPIRRPPDLLDHTLLFVMRPYEWQLWAKVHGLDLARARTLQLADYIIALQAAVDGQGVAMGRRRLVTERLRSGALMQPLAEWTSSDTLGHWLCRRQGAQRRQVSTFADWLTREAGAADA
jgi:LysR family glycine cleavage system transcriptional activator